MSRPSLFAALLIAFMAMHAQAASPGAGTLGVFTIVEGDVAVLRDTRRLAAVEGMRVRAEDILRSGGGARLARLELDDGTLLDLGPNTELLLQPRGLTGERAAPLYLLRGWLKVTTPAAGIALGSPRMDVRKVVGSTVLRVAPQATLMFVEAGRAELVERAEGRQVPHAVKEGDAFALRSTAAGAVLRRPPADLIEGLPRGFVDPLPRRAAAWNERSVEAGAGSPVEYADASPWLHAEPALRPGFVQRFTPMAQDRRFRAGLVAELRLHPEWDRVLFPEKYRPKPPPLPAPAASSIVRSDGELPVAVPRQWLEALEPGLSRPAVQSH